MARTAPEFHNLSAAQVIRDQIHLSIGLFLRSLLENQGKFYLDDVLTPEKHIRTVMG